MAIMTMPHETARRHSPAVDRDKLRLEHAIETTHQAFADTRRAHLAARAELALATHANRALLADAVNATRLAWVAEWCRYHEANLRLDDYLADPRTEH
jgi:hypothetical protein